MAAWLLILIQSTLTNSILTPTLVSEPTEATMLTDRMDDTLIEVPRGLANVAAATTALSDVRGLEGYYQYRQYSAIELARRRSFEHAWFLMLFGELPTAGELAEFRMRLSVARDVPESVRCLLSDIARATEGDSLAGLRMALEAVASSDRMPPLYEESPDRRINDAIRVAALTPVLLSALYRLSEGQEVLRERQDLGHVANYLYLTTGEVPDKRTERALSAYMTAAIDHGFNASTFTARVIASTGADLISAVVGAIGALSGPLHGGAPARALETLDAIGSLDRIDDWITDAVLSGRRIMGFGHPIYRTEDPRSRMLREIALEFADAGIGAERVAFATAVESRVLALLAELKPGRALHTNLEFYAAIVMELCGLPREMMTPTFAAARAVGWSAHILEQAADPKIIRPSSRFTGPSVPVPLPE
jgi:citrate synthase